jgi:hypothetical protein
MLISVHTAIGVIIAKKTTSSWAAFVVGVLAHFLLDFIPHGDRKLLHWFSRKINRDLILSLNILDAFITIFYLLYIYTYTNLPEGSYLFWAILGSVLPDFINIYYQILKPKALKPYSKFHQYIHDYIPSKMTVKEGLVLQLVLIVLLIYITV